MHHLSPSGIRWKTYAWDKWMKNAEQYLGFLGRLVWLLLALLSPIPAATAGQMTMGNDTDRTFPVLQTKTGAYTNVTVTKKTKDWIFILHSAGVCNIKTTDLSPEARVALGYDAPPKPAEEAKAEASTGSDDSSPSAAPLKPHLNLADVKKFANEWQNNRKEKMAQLTAFTNGNPTILLVALGSVAVIYIFVSTCFWLICRKTHIAPGPLVWVPVLQLIPLLRAANMSRVWFFAYFIPLLNIIAQIVWCIKIVKSRGKSPWVALLLLLPVTNFFAFLYLAFSRSAPVQIESNDGFALETA